MRNQPVCCEKAFASDLLVLCKEGCCTSQMNTPILRLQPSSQATFSPVPTIGLTTESTSSKAGIKAPMAEARIFHHQVTKVRANT